jgi:hypothetical protein
MPDVFDTCKADIWKMLTDKDERDKLMCLVSCEKDGEISPLCVTEKCGKAAFECLTDATCRDAVNCLPKAMLECSKSGFDCIFGHDSECRDNLSCLGNGLTACGDPAVNLMTDRNIASFVSCASHSCPHPQTGAPSTASAVAPVLNNASALFLEKEPSSTASQLLCMATKCGSKGFKLLGDQDSSDLFKCALHADILNLCSSVWECLGDKKCESELTCMMQPFKTCEPDIWHSLTDHTERQRIEDTAACLSKCQADNTGSFVDAGFCVLDSCSDKVLSCYHDPTCYKAVKCLPNTLEQCAVPVAEAYVTDKLFQNSVKCLGRGLESCGRAAVEMLRNNDVAEAVQCAAQCTRTPGAEVIV